MGDRDYRAELRKQLRFIRNSCVLYDQGDHDEAIRIGTVLRVLFYDPRHSTSVLTHLGLKDRVELLGTSAPPRGGPNEPPGMTPQFFFGLGILRHGPDGTYHIPRLDERAERTFLSISDWWKQVVWILDPETHVRRGDIILAAANKDGGAHVDAELTPAYERLLYGPFDTFFRFGVGGEGARGPANTHLVSLRQLGHEVLNSPDLTSLASISPPEEG